MVACALLVTCVITPGHVGADGSWLDGPVQNWNTPGMPITPAPDPQPPINPSCPVEGFAPTSPEAQAIVDAGWTLTQPYAGNAGAIRVIPARSQNYDGMCRSLGYQYFVFVDGNLAGTLSPEIMSVRTDGALTGTRIFGAASPIIGEYARYTPQDPLCCPSAKSEARFEIDRTGALPVLVLRSVTTTPTSAQPGPSPAPPLPTAVPQPSAQPAPTAPPVRAPAQAPASSRIHTVEGGDTLNRIAQRYGVTVAAIMQANGFTDRNRVLRVGERLIIPGP